MWDQHVLSHGGGDGRGQKDQEGIVVNKRVGEDVGACLEYCKDVLVCKPSWGPPLDTVTNERSSSKPPTVPR